MFIGVGGAVVLNIVGICKDLPIMFMQYAYHVGPKDVVLWCIHNILMLQLFVRGAICRYGGIMGSSYVIVSALKCVMTYESRK